MKFHRIKYHFNEKKINNRVSKDTYTRYRNLADNKTRLIRF